MRVRATDGHVPMRMIFPAHQTSIFHMSIAAFSELHHNVNTPNTLHDELNDTVETIAQVRGNPNVAIYFQTPENSRFSI